MAADKKARLARLKEIIKGEPRFEDGPYKGRLKNTKWWGIDREITTLEMPESEAKARAKPAY